MMRGTYQALHDIECEKESVKRKAKKYDEIISSNKTDLHEAAETAAKLLPPGYSVNIQIKKGGYVVELEDDDDGTRSVNDPGGIADAILQAVEDAVTDAADREMND